MARIHAYNFFTILALASAALLIPATASAQMSGSTRPALVVTYDPVPEDIQRRIYAQPASVPEITHSDVMGGYYDPATQSLVARKIKELENDLTALQNNLGFLTDDLNHLQMENEGRASSYFAAIATINTQLQSGTTPGNPRLIQKLQTAESSLELLNRNVTGLNELALRASDAASRAGFLLDQTRAAFSVSGAIEEDHVHLARVEDHITALAVSIDRVLNTITDGITRTNAYLNNERENLRALSLAVQNGDLYGRSLANRAYKPMPASNMSGGYSMDQTSAGLQPLVKIRFDQPHVDYQQPVYMAVSEALSRYPDAQFELVAVSPSQGNAAEVAIEKTRAKRNAEKVLRTLTEMGLPTNQVDMSSMQSAEAATNEVHLFVR